MISQFQSYTSNTPTMSSLHLNAANYFIIASLDYSIRLQAESSANLEVIHLMSSDLNRQLFAE